MKKTTFHDVAHLYQGIQGRMRDKGILKPGNWTLVGVNDHKRFGRMLTLRNEDGNEFGECPDMRFQPCMQDVKYITDETLIKVMKKLSLNDLSAARFTRNGFRWDHISMRAWLTDDEFEEMSWVDYNHFEYEYQKLRTKERHWPEIFNPHTEALVIMLADGYDFFGLLESKQALRMEFLTKY